MAVISVGTGVEVAGRRREASVRLKLIGIRHWAATAHRLELRDGHVAVGLYRSVDGLEAERRRGVGFLDLDRVRVHRAAPCSAGLAITGWPHLKVARIALVLHEVDGSRLLGDCARQVQEDAGQSREAQAEKQHLATTGFQRARLDVRKCRRATKDLMNTSQGRFNPNQNRVD